MGSDSRMPHQNDAGRRRVWISWRLVGSVYLTPPKLWRTASVACALSAGIASARPRQYKPFDLGRHADVSTTMVYTHVLKVGGGAVRSPNECARVEPFDAGDQSTRESSAAGFFSGSASNLSNPQ